MIAIRTLRTALTTSLAMAVCLAHASVVAAQDRGEDRPRARELGVEVGVFEPGSHNAITDVAGVLVGQVTVATGDRVNTGVTAVRPHPGTCISIACRPLWSWGTATESSSG